MTDHTPAAQTQVDAYLAALRGQLAGLPADDVEEILRELRGHIVERGAESDSGRNRPSVAQILRQLGTPEQIGSLYRADALVAHARETFSPALIIRTTLRWASKTVAGFVASFLGLIGYSIGVGLIVCAILKPFLPGDIGLWVNSSDGFVLGVEVPRPHGPELLGWWIIPYGLAVGVAFILGTTVFLRWMLRFVPRATGRVAPRAIANEAV